MRLSEALVKLNESVPSKAWSNSGKHFGQPYSVIKVTDWGDGQLSRIVLTGGEYPSDAKLWKEIDVRKFDKIGANDRDVLVIGKDTKQKILDIACDMFMRIRNKSDYEKKTHFIHVPEKVSDCRTKFQTGLSIPNETLQKFYKQSDGSWYTVRLGLTYDRTDRNVYGKDSPIKDDKVKITDFVYRLSYDGCAKFEPKK